MSKPTKQVIIIRKDLKMRRGKECAQASHASMAFITRQLVNGNDKVKLSESAKEWMENSFTKVCLQVDSEKELLEIFKSAKEKGLEVHLVTDAGFTEFNGIPTKTVVAIGPNLSSEIDPVTSHLKLY